MKAFLMSGASNGMMDHGKVHGEFVSHMEPGLV
jgi:hypothetical protein